MSENTENTQNGEVQVGRKILVVSSKGQKLFPIENCTATTWGELVEIIQGTYDLNSMKAVDNINKHTYDHIDAPLPTGDFRMFLRPTKTKSGADAPDYGSYGFAQLRGLVAEDVDFKVFIITRAADKSKSWTQLQTVELRELAIEYYANQDGEVEEEEDLDIEEDNEDSDWNEEEQEEEQEEEEEKSAMATLDQASNAVSTLFTSIEEVVEDINLDPEDFNGDSDELSDRFSILKEEWEGFKAFLEASKETDEDRERKAAEAREAEAKVEADRKLAEELEREEEDLFGSM